jgi:hypothetical protein
VPAAVLALVFALVVVVVMMPVVVEPPAREGTEDVEGS